MIYLYIYIIELYLVTKRNEILPFVTTWLDLKGILLSEISKIETSKYHMISLIFEIKNIPTNNNNNNNKNWIQDTENRFLIAKDRAWGMEEMGEGVKKINKNFILDIRYK